MESLEKRFWAKVDKNSHNGCWVWTASKMQGYGVISISAKKTALAHRVSFEMANGVIPNGFQLDHICCNRSCVNPEHLRLCGKAENGWNTGAKITNKSGFKGVSWSKHAGKWRTTIRANGRQNHIGYFSTATEAHEAYSRAAKLFHGEFSNNGVTK